MGSKAVYLHTAAASAMGPGIGRGACAAELKRSELEYANAKTCDERSFDNPAFRRGNYGTVPADVLEAAGLSSSRSPALQGLGPRNTATGATGNARCAAYGSSPPPRRSVVSEPQIVQSSGRSPSRSRGGGTGGYDAVISTNSYSISAYNSSSAIHDYDRSALMSQRSPGADPSLAPDEYNAYIPSTRRRAPARPSTAYR